MPFKKLKPHVLHRDSHRPNIHNKKASIDAQHRELQKSKYTQLYNFNSCPLASLNPMLYTELQAAKYTQPCNFHL